MTKKLSFTQIPVALFMLLLLILSSSCTLESNASTSTNINTGTEIDNNSGSLQKPNDSQNSETEAVKVDLSDELKVYFLDVGQGDSTLITLAGESMLIDSGERENASMIIEFLQKLGIEEITHLVATHPHADHIGGMADIIKNCGIKNVYMPKIIHNTKTFENMLDAIESKGLQIESPKPGSKIVMGDSIFTVYGPIEETSDLNNNSIEMRLQYGDISFMFTGDGEKDEEISILKLYGDELKSDVIKVPHHGSNTSSTVDFINAVMPSYAVISVGEGNDYNHPSPQIVERYETIGSEILRTDLLGMITFSTDGKSLSYTNGNLINTEEAASSINIAQSDIIYIGNKNSKKFHLHTCGSLPIEKNRVELSNREEAIMIGYDPCLTCNP